MPADAVDEGLGEWGDVFAVIAQRWQGEARCGEPECKVGDEAALSGKLPKRNVCRDEQKDSRQPAGFILEHFDQAEQQRLASGGQQIYAIEVEGAGGNCSVGLCGEPFAGVVSAEREFRVWGLTMEGLREEMFSGSGFTFEAG